MKLSASSLVAAAIVSLTATAPAVAQEFAPKTAGTWIVNARATVVAPDENAPVTDGAGAATGLSAAVSDDVKPTLGVTYFLTDNIAVEAIAGTTQHEIRAQGPGVDAAVHETWVLPPVVTVQYHLNPEGRFSPYVGAGVNYMLFYGGDDKNGFDVEIDNGFGWALQAGADFALNGAWSLNADVKKVFFETDASINDGALKSKVDLDPWVVSVGFGRRF